MKVFFKYLGVVIASFLVLAYLCFLFVLPNAINLNKYETEVKKLAKDYAKINISYENPKIITTPLLGAGLKADNIYINLPDGSLLFSAESIKTRISLPSLLLLTVKVSCFEAENPFVNLEIANNENFKIVKLIETLVNPQKEQELEEVRQTAETGAFHFNPKWIRIKVPNVKLDNYRILVNDLKSEHFLELKGEELRFGYFNGKTAKIKTFNIYLKV